MNVLSRSEEKKKVVEAELTGYAQVGSRGKKSDVEDGGRANENQASGNLQVSNEDAPVIRAVNALICRAIKERASDIHLEPSEDGLRIRLRLDGVLHDLGAPQGLKPAHIISRVKIMANLDIAERRLPQDGKIQLHNNGN